MCNMRVTERKLIPQDTLQILSTNSVNITLLMKIKHTHKGLHFYFLNVWITLQKEVQNSKILNNDYANWINWAVVKMQPTFSNIISSLICQLNIYRWVESFAKLFNSIHFWVHDTVIGSLRDIKMNTRVLILKKFRVQCGKTNFENKHW